MSEQVSRPSCPECGERMIGNGYTSDGRRVHVCRRHKPNVTMTENPKRRGCFGRGRIKRRPPPCPVCGVERAWKVTAPGQRWSAECLECGVRALSDKEMDAVRKDEEYPPRDTWKDSLVNQAKA